MKTFQIGEVVRINSGGPPMTVRAITQTGAVKVYFFDDDGDPCTGTFGANMLTLVPDDEAERERAKWSGRETF